MAKLLSRRKNGNTTITLLDDGTKIREWPDGEDAFFEYPESLDVKITNWCNAGCEFCFESSTKAGKHGDIHQILQTLEDLPAGTELAIGGGHPLAHPDIEYFLQTLKDRGIVCNITCNALHLKSYSETITDFRNRKLIWGLGISYHPQLVQLIKDHTDPNTIVHFIIGVHSPADVYALPKGSKILILGYKHYGFGTSFAQLDATVLDKSQEFFNGIREVMAEYHCSFDNLALKQLDLKRHFSKDFWDSHYMGNDGTHTMYIDGTENAYGVTSTAPREALGGMKIREAFEKVKQKTLAY